MKAGVWLMLVLSTILWLCLPAVAGEADRLDMSAPRLLVVLFDKLVEANPDYELIEDGLSRLSRDQRQDSLHALASMNEARRELRLLIDSLLSTEAYNLYFRQFRYIDREVQRQVLNALPYGALKAPGGIGNSLKQLFDQREQLASWLDFVGSGVDLGESREIANGWLLAEAQQIPPTYVVLDGYGDAFAREAKVVIDLYSVALQRRPVESRFSSSPEDDIRRITETLAHEYHHVFAAQYLYPEGMEWGDWPKDWFDFFRRKMISEGIAMHCNPPSGFKQQIIEDSLVVTHWIRELNATFRALFADSITGDQVAEWYQESSQESARELLQEYLAQRYPEEEVEKLVRVHQIDRPMMIYTLGWWMIESILSGPEGRAGVIRLLSEPEWLFVYYNESLGIASHRFRVVPGGL